MMDVQKYRRLEKGEIIQEGDEVDNCGNPYKDEPKWVPAKCIGDPAPDPQYIAHRRYRRKVFKNIPSFNEFFKQTEEDK